MENKLVYYRNRAGLTQAQLADRSGILKTTISKLETGYAKLDNLTLKNACALANVLNIHAEDLLPDSPPENS